MTLSCLEKAQSGNEHAPLEPRAAAWDARGEGADLAKGQGDSVKELMRTNDAVLISFVEALLKSEEIDHIVLDRNMSVLDGSLGILQCRIMVEAGQHSRAVAFMRDAGLDAELRPDDAGR